MNSYGCMKELKFLSNYTVEHGPKSPLREKNRKEDLLNNHNFSESLKDRSIGRREEGFSSCLPRHPDSHQKRQVQVFVVTRLSFNAHHSV